MSGLDPVEALLAKDEIRDLVIRYSAALEARDMDAMVDLFVPHARFGSFGEGPEALRRLTEESLAGSHMAVVLVTNHRIDVQSADVAIGEVWARCYAQSLGDGYVEQLLKYEDRYERYDGAWRFLFRRHRLWFGVAPRPSPLAQSEAHWPEHQTGVGDVPFENPAFVEWWRARRD
jgi:hypothetical protein